LKVQKIQIFKEESFYIESFVIDLAFACLREAASAKAGILTFELSNSR